MSTSAAILTATAQPPFFLHKIKSRQSLDLMHAYCTSYMYALKGETDFDGIRLSERCSVGQNLAECFGDTMRYNH